MIDLTNIRIATPKIINKYYSNKKKYCKSYKFYRLKCLRGKCNDCDHCIAVAFIQVITKINNRTNNITNEAIIFLRKHKKIKNNDSNLIDYVSSIIQHEMMHIALLNVGEPVSDVHKYDNIAKLIEERNGFPSGFFDEFDGESYIKKFEREY